MRNDDLMTRKMLSTIRENEQSKTSKTMLTEEAKSKGESNDKTFKITKDTPQFSDVRISQEEAIVKTIGESIELSDDALVYYADDDEKNLVFTGKINALKVIFQFQSNDKSGEGCYIWANALQLTETNNRTLGKIRNAFVNWKNGLINNGDLLGKIHKAAINN